MGVIECNWILRKKTTNKEEKGKEAHGLLTKKLKPPLETLDLQVHLNLNKLYISNHILQDK